jgi:two-component system response regulator HydG
LADGGTLFLDEVAELSDALQVKLLRVLQDGQVEPVGADEAMEVDTRVIGATNQTVSPHDGESPLRSDLFFRLNVLQMEVPPLRERPSDIEPMWHHFVREAARAEARHDLSVDDAVIDRLTEHSWPGNVRELRNVARHCTVVAQEGLIDVDALPGYLQKQGDSEEADLPLVGRSLEELERTAILQTCDSVSTVKQAAELLGVSERTVYYRKKEYGDTDGDETAS